MDDKVKFLNKPKNWYTNHSIIHNIFKKNTILHKCFIPKKYFDRTNIICKNNINDKKGIEIDFVKINENGVIDLIELTNTMTIDKKNNLLDTKQLLILNGLFVDKLCIIDSNTINTIS